MENTEQDENIVRNNRRRSVRNLRRHSGIQPLDWNISDEIQQGLAEVYLDSQKQQELYGSLWFQTAEPVVKKRRRQSSQFISLPLHQLVDKDEWVTVSSNEIEDDIKVSCSISPEANKLTTSGEENLSKCTQPVISPYIIPSRTSVHAGDYVSSMLNDSEKELVHSYIFPSFVKKLLTPHEEEDVSKSTSTSSSISPVKLHYHITLEKSYTEAEFENINNSKCGTKIFDKPSTETVTKVTSSPLKTFEIAARDKNNTSVQNLNILQKSKFNHLCDDYSVSVDLYSVNPPADGSKNSMSPGNNFLDKEFADNIEKLDTTSSNLLNTRIVENIVANSVSMPILKEGNQKNVLVSNSDPKSLSKPDIEAMFNKMEAHMCKDDKSKALHSKLSNFTKHKKPRRNVRTWSDVGKLTSKENKSMHHTEVNVPIRVSTSCTSKNVEKPPFKLSARKVDRVGKKDDWMVGNIEKTAFEILDMAHKTQGDVKSSINKVSSNSEASLSKTERHRKMFLRTLNDVTYELNKMAKSCITETDDGAEFFSTISKGFISDKPEKIIANSDDLNPSVQTILLSDVNDCKMTTKNCSNALENCSDVHHVNNSVCAAQPELHTNNAEQIFLQDTNSESADHICGKLEMNLDGSDKKLSVISIDESPRLNLNQTHTLDSNEQNNVKSGMCLAERENDMAKILISAERENDMAKILISDHENIINVRENSLIDNKLFKWKKRQRALHIPNNVADEIQQSFANLNPYIDMKTSTDNQKIFDLQTNGHNKVKVKKAKFDENAELGDFVTRRKNLLPKRSSKLDNASTLTFASTYPKNGFGELLKEGAIPNLEKIAGEELVNSVKTNKMDDMFNSSLVSGAANFEVESNIITHSNGELIEGNSKVNDMQDDKFVDRKIKNKLSMIDMRPSETVSQKTDKGRLTNCRRKSSKFEIIYEVAETSETNAHLFESSGNACVKQPTIQSDLEKTADLKDHLNIKCLNGRKHLKPSSDSERSAKSTCTNDQAEIENARLKTRSLNRNCLSDDTKVVHSPKNDLDFDSDISKHNIHESAGLTLNDESSKESPGDGMSQIAVKISRVSLEDKVDCSHFSVTDSCAQPEITVENLELPEDTAVQSFSKQIISGRSRRRSADAASLKIQLQMKGPEDNIKANNSHSSIPGLSTKLNLKHKLKKETDEDLENVYKNKNFVKPEKKPWQTIFENPEDLQATFGKKRCPRFIEFEKPTQMKLRKRLQRAVKNGWDLTKKRKASIPDDIARSKLDKLWSELDSDDVS